MEITKEIRKQLREPFPDEAISQHPTKTFLSTIKAIYVVERLNDVFGIGGWDVQHWIVSDSEEYVSVCGKLLYGRIEDGTFAFSTPEQYGGHKKTGKNTEPADGYKSAVTDCQSKCASYLEIGIDVFKGKHKVHSAGSQEPSEAKTKPPSNDMSPAQRKYIKDLGKEIGMTAEEVGIMVKWAAGEHNLDPNHWKTAKLFLGGKDEDSKQCFAEQLRLYSEAQGKEQEEEVA